MKIDKIKPFYSEHKVKIYSIYLLFFIFLSWYGTTNNYSYKSFQDCLLSKVQGNAQLLTIAKVACEKEVQTEFEELKKERSHQYDFKGALEAGWTIFDIYETLSNNEIKFATVKSIDNGIKKLLYHDGSRGSNALKGLLLGCMTGLSIGLVIELLMMIFKGRKSEK